MSEIQAIDGDQAAFEIYTKLLKLSPVQAAAAVAAGRVTNNFHNCQVTVINLTTVTNEISDSQVVIDQRG